MNHAKLQYERRKPEVVPAAPELQRQRFREQTSGPDVPDLLGDVGLKPSVVPELPKRMKIGPRAASPRDQVYPLAVQSDSLGLTGLRL